MVSNKSAVVYLLLVQVVLSRFYMSSMKSTGSSFDTVNTAFMLADPYEASQDFIFTLGFSEKNVRAANLFYSSSTWNPVRRKASINLPYTLASSKYYANFSLSNKCSGKDGRHTLLLVS